MKIFKYIATFIIIISLFSSCDFLNTIFMEQEGPTIVVNDSIELVPLIEYKQLLLKNSKLQDKVDSLQQIQDLIL